MKIHHIGYAVKNIEKSEISFQQLGYQSEGEMVVDYQRNVKILFMMNENYRIELVESYDTEKVSPVDKYLLHQKDTAVPYHLCYEVSDIDSKIGELRKEKFILVEFPNNAPAINNAKVAFLYKRTIGLIELVEA
ncbi:MAG: VOC family protein [Lachnospiraceae bacterium]|nr:VOC family protein [Lachnospiraceae bacterium]